MSFISSLLYEKCVNSQQTNFKILQTHTRMQVACNPIKWWGFFYSERNLFSRLLQGSKIEINFLFLH